MNIRTFLASFVAVLALLTPVLRAQVPQLISYQGRVSVGTTNFNSPPNGLFKFALVDAAGTTTYWSNDGTSTAGSQPTAAVTLTVTKGLYSVLLGDATLANMTIVPATVFTNADVRLRVWFNDGTNGSQLLTPDQRIAAVGYAMMAGNVSDGAITAAKLANGAVGSAQIAAGAVQSANIGVGAVASLQLGDNAVTAAKIGTAQVVKTLNALTDSVTLAPGANVTLTAVGNTLTLGAPNVLSGISHNSTLSGTGTGASPLTLAVPLSLSGSGPVLSVASSNDIAGSFTGGAGAYGLQATGGLIGLYAYGSSSIGVEGDTATAIGVWGRSSGSGDGVFGSSTAGSGVSGTTAVAGDATAGVKGVNSANGGTGIIGIGNSANGAGVAGVDDFANSTGLYGRGTAYGVFGQSALGEAGHFQGKVGVSGQLLANNGLNDAIVGTASGPFYGISGTSPGILQPFGLGTIISGGGVSGTSTIGYGVNGQSSSGPGISGGSSSGVGVSGSSNTGDGIYGSTSTAGTSVAGVVGTNFANGGTGIIGEGYAANGAGVAGVADFANSTGVYGRGSHYGVYGESSDNLGAGVVGITHYPSDSTHNATGIHGICFTSDNFAGFFDGNVGVSTILYVSGTKNFKIDHPLDPANKYLVHASVESPDVMNIYNGNIITDANGEAQVELPSYFEALNRDFRYQLTSIGQFAQAIVASEVHNNEFSIKTDRPNVKVSWQITGIRQDAYMQAHPMIVEQDKPPGEQGTYQHPELFGQPEEKGFAWKQDPMLMKRLKEERIKRETAPKP